MTKLIPALNFILCFFCRHLNHQNCLKGGKDGGKHVRCSWVLVGGKICFEVTGKEFGKLAALAPHLIYLHCKFRPCDNTGLKLGDLEGAKSSFDVVEGIVNDEKMQAEMRNLVNRNKALMFMVRKDYVSAVREYQDCIDRDATDVVEIKNKGLCLMYLKDLADGIKVLEKVLESVPTAALNET
ncbi:trafficking protein particle complex subunit 12-like protein [Tanacetum coccineum]